MGLIGRIEAGVNWFTDRNWLWWPVARLRPKPTERFSRRLVVVLSLPVTIAVTIFCLGIAIRDVGWSGENADYPQTPAMWAAVAFLLALILFFIWGSLVKLMAYCWNRRAVRLTGAPMESERVVNARLRGLQPVAPSSRGLTNLVVVSLIVYTMVAFEGTGESPDAGQGVGLLLLFPAGASVGLMLIWRLVVWRVARLRLTGATAYKAAFAGVMFLLDLLLLTVPGGGNWSAMSLIWIVVLSGIVVLVHAVIAAIIRHPETGPIGLRTGTLVSITYCSAVAAVGALGWALIGTR